MIEVNFHGVTVVGHIQICTETKTKAYFISKNYCLKGNLWETVSTPNNMIAWVCNRKPTNMLTVAILKRISLFCPFSLVFYYCPLIFITWHANQIHLRVQLESHHEKSVENRPTTLLAVFKLGDYIFPFEAKL